MRTDSPTSRPTLTPLRVVSDVLDEVEGDLASMQRDLVVAERVGKLALAAAALLVAVAIVLFAVRRLRRHRGPDGDRAPASPAPVGPDLTEPTVEGQLDPTERPGADGPDPTEPPTGR